MNFTAIKLYAEKNDVPITKDDTMQFIVDYINQNKVEHILEIGTAIAYGSINMAMCDSVKSVTTLEIDTTNYREALNNIAKYNLLDKIDARLIDAKLYIDECDKKFDLIYLDGPKGQYINYLPYLLKLLNKGGIIFADNLNFHGMVTGETPITKGCRAMIKGLKNYITEITTNQNLETQIFTNIGDGVGVSKLKY